jgi:hypothetical protein
MLYKMDRTSRMLGMDLRQAENQFAVWLPPHSGPAGRHQRRGVGVIIPG